MQLITLAASTALFASTALAGQAYVHNKCSWAVNLWTADAVNGESKMQTIQPNGTWNEEYKILSTGGVSIKLTGDDNCYGAISQFEYTYQPTQFIWYDMSNVNCVGSNCPFAKEGWYLGAGQDCPTRQCDGGLGSCSGAYNAYNDDQNTLSCTPNSDINLYLCSSSAPSNGTTTTTTAQAAKREEAPAHKHKHRHPHWRH